MTNTRSLSLFTLVVAALACLMALTGKDLAEKMRFGLEFRGGYEIYYVATPAEGKATVSSDDMLKTAAILAQRADTIGMAEPDIRVEGDNHIRVKLAGLTSADESRSLLGNSAGLPTVLTEKYTQTVGSVLGNTALKETLTAGLIGVACIFFLLVFLYRGMGAVAAFCTVVYLWLLVILFNASHATLSLSAVVAFVLGIGLAADASIICFERVREELSRLRSPEEAVRLGFKGSFPTIRDANLVTGLAMIALFVAGIGPIQGFSLTMLASLVISVGTNFFFVRALCLLLARSNVLKPSVLVGWRGPAKVQRLASFDFVGFGRKAILISAVVIAAGTIYFRAHGMNLDIDFTAGTALDIDLDKAIDQDTATRIMTEAGTVPATAAIGGKGADHIAARFDEVLKPADLKKIIAAFKSKYAKVEYEENTADPGVAREFATRAIYAILAAFGSIALYIGLRFSWSIAVATVVPIVHDVVLVSAIFALFKLEIDVTYIAALLTIIGYSLNDKIVIFGRIRENLKGMPPTTPLRQLVNASVRQTLGRSIYTVLTVVLASACLYQFACEPLEMFALAILLGLISGAYSSIFMSTIIWLAIRAKAADATATERSTPYLVSRSFVGLLALVSVVGVAGWYVNPLAAAPTAEHAARTPAAVGPLGDLAPYARIGADTLELVKKADFAAAKDRITELESAWDQAEETMRPMSPEDWATVDKSIDRALAQVRSGKPDGPGAEAALTTMIAKMNSLSPGSGAAEAAAPTHGPLGDLSVHLGLAAATLKLAEAGDLKAARDRA